MVREEIDYLSRYINMILSDNFDILQSIWIIRENNILEMEDSDFNCISLDYDVRKFFHQYQSSRMLGAYEPFTDIVADIISSENINMDELFDEADVYPMHRSIFKSYFLDRKARRHDEPILPECEYEKEKFIKGLRNLLCVVARRKPLFVMLNRINLIPDSSLNIINEFITEPDSNIKILAISNEFGYVNTYMKDKYIDFRKCCEDKDMIIAWPFGMGEAQKKTDTVFVFKNSDIEEYIYKLNSMFYTFAFDQAAYYLNIIYQKIELEKANIDSIFKIDMLAIYIKTCIFKQNYSYALLMCDSLRQIEDKHVEKSKNYYYYLLSAMADMYSGNDKDAKEYSAISLNYAADEFQRFYSLLTMNMAQLSGWKDIWICEKEIEVSEEIISLCKKYGFENHLAHIYVYCFDNDASLYDKVEGVEERTHYVSEGVAIAKKHKNDQFLIEAYRKNVMVSSYNGNFATSDYFYKKSIIVAKRTGDEMEEANIYNGLGYNNCTADRYELANEYYNKALKIFYNHRSSDYVVETLYNMGMNAILAGDFKHATEYLVSVSNILRMLKKNGLRVCNISKIFGLIALSTFRQGHFYTAQFYVNKSNQFLENLLEYNKDEFYNYLWDDDMFLYYHVKGLLLLKDNKEEEGLLEINKAVEFMERSQGSKFFTYPQYIYDLVNYYRDKGNEDKAKQLIEEGIAYFESNGNEHKVENLLRLKNNEEWKFEEKPMKLIDTSLEKIMKAVRVESIEESAKAKKKDFSFFVTFQELINHQYESVEDIINTLVSNFRNNFNLDNVLFISCEDGKSEVKFSDFTYDINEDEINRLVSFFNDNPAGFALSKFSNNYQEYEKVLSIFKRSKIFSIIASPIFKNEKMSSIFVSIVKIQESWNSAIDREVMDEEDLETFQFVFRQIIEAIEKYKLNEMLKIQAVTDELTGLLNRKGYYQKIDEILEQYKETGHKSKLTFMYADLDHFKYYNDTFGHHVGDAILIQFARIFDAACGDYGKVIRFGGDEFVILVDTVDRGIINKIITNIYDSVNRENGFLNIVKRYISYDFEIPEKYMATCSIGIVVKDDVSEYEQISDMRKLADATLYSVKHTGRGRAVVAELQ